MSECPPCPKCTCEYTYEDGNLFICPECSYEWSKHEAEESTEKSAVKDAVGNILHDGDDVTIFKDSKVKGAPKPLKAGTKVKNIKLVDAVNGHDIDAKVPGFGQMMLKSSIVKKST
jgi:protein PhnA